MQKQLVSLYLFICYLMGTNAKVSVIYANFNLVKSDAILEKSPFKTLRTRSIIDCISHCRIYTRDECQSVNYREGNCLLYDEQSRSDSNIWKEAKGYFHYNVELPPEAKSSISTTVSESVKSTSDEISTTVKITTALDIVETEESTTVGEETSTTEIQPTTTVMTTTTTIMTTTLFDESEFEMGAAATNWPGAKSSCPLGKRMVIIDSKEKYNRVLQFLEQVNCIEDVWIGLQWNKDVGQFLWVNDVALDEFKDFQNWLPNEPSRETLPVPQECIGMSAIDGWKWYDASCLDVHQFVCEIDPDKA